MKVNNFSAEITGGRETGNGHVAMQHGSKYSIHMKNHGAVQCDAEVTVDGKPVGEFRIRQRGSIKLERPADDDGCFTFYAADSEDAKSANLDSVSTDNMGLVTVVFRPEKRRTRVEQHTKSLLRSRSGPSGSTVTNDSFIPGGTGLSGKSDQSFTEVAPLDYDDDGTTTIYLRLVADDGPRELKSKPSNDIPKPV